LLEKLLMNLSEKKPIFPNQQGADILNIFGICIADDGRIKKKKKKEKYLMPFPVGLAVSLKSYFICNVTK